MTSYPPRPIDLEDLTVDRLGKMVTVGDGNSHLLGRLVEIRHRFAADSSMTAASGSADELGMPVLS